MKPRVLSLRIIVVIVLTLTICVGSTEGLTNHGFYWGIEIGDRFDYHMELRLPDSSKNKALDYYVVVDDLPSIDENITDIPQITGDVYDWNNYHSFYLMNDTRITSQTNISDDLRQTLHWRAFPVGNWSLVNDLFLIPKNNSLFEVQTFDTAADWGYSITGIVFGITVTETGRYSKETGALIFYELNDQRFNESIYSVQITIVGDAVPLFVLIGGASIGLLVVALAVLKKRV
ncbi:MAG: hypothetical protein ACFFAZ_00050 [Promethearchaeota archaeon]